MELVWSYHEVIRWTTVVTNWKPKQGGRKRGRPTTRWEDDLVAYDGPGWKELTKEKTRWKNMLCSELGSIGILLRFL